MLEAAKPELAFDRADDIDRWRAALDARLREVVGDGGRRFYADDAWPVFAQLSGWPAG